MPRRPPPPFPKGHPRYGGIKKGTKLRKTLLREAAEREAKKGLVSPLQYLEAVINDPRAGKGLRQDAAKAALPYRHSKKPQAHVMGRLEDMTDEQLRALLGDDEPEGGG